MPSEARVGAAPGRSVAARCHASGITSADHWAEATGHLTLKQGAQTSEIAVTLENGRPDTLYTIWLMLGSKTANGEPFGGNPLAKGGATALGPTSPLPEAVEFMQAARSEASNGFTTDGDGNGSVTISLDFPIVGGAYPFQRLGGFDPSDPAYARATPRAVPVATIGKSAGALFTLRLESHCGDNRHGGLVPGQSEAWFSWLAG